MVSPRFKKFRLVCVFLFLSIIFGLAACSRTAACPDPLGCVELAPGQSLTVGVAVPLTGPNRSAGAAALAAIQAQADQTKSILGHGLFIQKTDFNCAGEISRTAAERLTGDETLAGVISSSCILESAASQQVFGNAGIVVITRADPHSHPVPSRGIVQIAPQNAAASPEIDAEFAIRAVRDLLQAVSRVAIQQPDGSLLIPRQALENRLQLSSQAD